MTALDPRALRNAFGTFMTGVTVVTTRDAEGTPLGFTANSFSSVSLDPPLVLVCLANSSKNYDAFAGGKGFAVNILSEGQKDISNTFARPVADRFADLDWQDGPAGNPVIGGVSAWFDCTLHSAVPAGDHVILIGAVQAFHAEPTPGLGYARGAYVTPSREVEALEGRTEIMVSALIKQDDRVLLVGGKDGKLSLPESRAGKEGVSATLARLIDATGLRAEPGFIYAVYEDLRRGCQHITFLCEAEPGTPAVGAFTDLIPSTLMDINDPALCTMLKRFADEARIGNFGVYYGNESRGQVRAIAKGVN